MVELRQVPDFDVVLSLDSSVRGVRLREAGTPSSALSNLMMLLPSY